MRTARLLKGPGLAVAAAGLAVAAAGLAVAPAAYADDTGSLEIHPATVTPGAQVTVSTRACGARGSAAGDAGAVGAGTFALAPGEGGEYPTGRFRVPPSAEPATYQIVASCEGGRQLTGDLLVALAGSQEHGLAGDQPVHPRGHVKTGVGGALGRDPVRTAAGVTALAVAAAGGTWLLHRRARGDGI